MRCNYENVAAE